MNEVKKNSPWITLISLLGFTFLGAVVFQMLAFLIIALVWRNFDVSALSNPLQMLENGKSLLYVSLASSSIGTFLFPVLAVQKIENKQYRYLLNQPQNFGLFLGISFLFLLVSNPILGLVSQWNMEMSLPESLKGIELWMRHQEDAMALLTEGLVMVDSYGLLLANILVMAIIPAIVEEFFFRGVLQRVFNRMFKNGHAAIWVTAIIFSAIHVQFFGFFPRMILGLIFGYAFFWTRNIWVPVFAHFINNASVTILAFIYHKQGKSFAQLQDSEAFSPIIYLSSLILTIIIGYYFYKKTREINITDGYKLD